MMGMHGGRGARRMEKGVWMVTKRIREMSVASDWARARCEDSTRATVRHGGPWAPNERSQETASAAEAAKVCVDAMETVATLLPEANSDAEVLLRRRLADNALFCRKAAAIAALAARAVSERHAANAEFAALMEDCRDGAEDPSQAMAGRDGDE